MNHVERLLQEYKEVHRAGAEVDPGPFLEQVSGVERAALVELIDAYLTRAPRRKFNAAAFRESPAASVAEATQRSLAGASGLWPAILPRLRTQARMRRSELVAELAARLGAQRSEEKVASYYHEMEQGLLPASGVSDTVLDALGRIVGWSREALRRAGEMPAAGGPAAGGASGAVFARRAPGATAPPSSRPLDAAPRVEEWDEVDRLFRGGA